MTEDVRSQLKRAFAREPAAQASPALEADVLAYAFRHTPRPPRWVPAVAAAVAMLVIGAGVGATILLSHQLSLNAKPHRMPLPIASPSPAPTSSPAASGEAATPNCYQPVLAAVSSSVALRALQTEIQLTSDGGYHWTTVHRVSVPTGCIWDMQWVGSDYGFASAGDGLWFFANGGQTWSRVGSRPDLWHLDFLDRTHGFAIALLTQQLHTELLRTDDGGHSFQRVANGSLDDLLNGVTWVQFLSSSRGWIAGANGVLETSDGGHTWHRQLTFNAGPNGIEFEAQVGFADAADGFAYFRTPGTVAQQSGGVLFHTRDGGGHWTAVSNTGGYVPIAPESSQGAPGGLPSGEIQLPGLVVTGAVAAVVLDWTVANHFYVSRTTDSGSHWSAVVLPGSNKGVATMQAVGGRLWILLVDGGSQDLIDEVSSDGGVTWRLVDRTKGVSS